MEGPLFSVPGTGLKSTGGVPPTVAVWDGDALVKPDGTTVTPGEAGDGTGDVLGASSSVDSELSLFSGTGGKTLKRAAGISTDGTSRVRLGVAGTSVGGLELRNATSGSVSIVPPSGALGTAVLTTPIGTDTLVGAAATQTLSNKTFVSPALGEATATTINSTAIPSSSTLATAESSVTLSSGTNLTRSSHGNRLLICDTAATHVIQDDTAGGFGAADAIYGINTSAGVVTFAGESTGTASTVTAGPGLTLSVPPGQEFGFSRTAAHTWVGGAADNGLPQNSQSAAYTTVWADRNKQIFHPASDDNARTFTIAANASVPYPIGTTLTFPNKINTVTIAINSDTLTLAGAGSTGSRTLAANGIATAVKIAATEWMINGTGLT